MTETSHREPPDWPPQGSAVGLPDGTARFGSTGQSFVARGGRWERAEERRTVKVACTFPNGLMIRKSKPGVDDGTGDGEKMPAHDGPGVRLNGPSALHTGVGATQRDDLPPGITEVDGEWWDAWLAQNPENPLITQKVIYLLEEDEPDPNPTPGPSPAPSPKAES